MTRTADAIIVVEWGVICSYFIWRYLRFRKLVSFALAIMALGWMLLGMNDHLQQTPCDPGWWPKFAAMAIGAFVWGTVVRVERTGR